MSADVRAAISAATNAAIIAARRDGDRGASGSERSPTRWRQQVGHRLWSALCETGATVALQHGITMVVPPTVHRSSAHRAGEAS